jgi:predicted MFS family arabinose efflux permease
MSSRLPLWRQPDFRRLWAAQSVSDFGARITREGLPMMAVITLAASPSQLGLLAAMASGAALLVGLSAGGFVDRSQRRHILIGADLVRAAVLVTVPIAAFLHLLTIWQVYAAAALVASASVLFSIADHAYLPGLVHRADITDANAKISATESVAELGGPALAGLLFQWLTAPFAVAVNAATYLVSALFLAQIEAREPPPETEPRRRRWTDGIRTGAATAWAEPRVRPRLLMSAASGLFGGIFSALYIVFALRTLHLTPALLGLTIACGGLGAVAGSLIAPPMARRLGLGPALIVADVLAVSSALLIPLAPPDPAHGMGMLIAAQLAGDCFGVVVLILAVSLRQSLIPQKLLGRLGATFQAAGGATAVVGALAGGAFAQAFGVRQLLFVAVAGLGLGPLIALVSPLRRVREIPQMAG